MKIQGTVEVILDGVDIEQALLKDGGTMGRKIFLIMAAAYAHPDIVALKLFCDRTKHCIVFYKHQALDAEHELVIFTIREKTDHEIVAEDCGL